MPSDAIQGRIIWDLLCNGAEYGTMGEKSAEAFLGLMAEWGLAVRMAAMKAVAERQASGDRYWTLERMEKFIREQIGE